MISNRLFSILIFDLETSLKVTVFALPRDIVPMKTNEVALRKRGRQWGKKPLVLRYCAPSPHWHLMDKVRTETEFKEAKIWSGEFFPKYSDLHWAFWHHNYYSPNWPSVKSKCAPDVWNQLEGRTNRRISEQMYYYRALVEQNLIKQLLVSYIPKLL